MQKTLASMPGARYSVSYSTRNVRIADIPETRPMAEKGLVQSLARGIDILRVLAEAREGLPLAELVVRCGLKRPTLHSLVRTLESRGLVARR